MKRSPIAHDRVFDGEFAQKYAKHHKKMAEQFGNEYALKLQKRDFKGGRILDAGCGFGATNIVLAETFPESEVYGIDMSEPLLDIARQSVELHTLSERVFIKKADVHHIPYDDHFFNVVLSINMLHLVDEPLTMLDELERVLSKDGILFIADLRRSWLGLVEREIKSAYTLAEAKEVIGQSSIRAGQFYSGLLWWRYETS